MSRFSSLMYMGLTIIFSLTLISCGTEATPPHAVQPTAASTLSEQQIATLNSLEKVDEYLLYTMQYYGSSENGLSFSTDLVSLPTWGCSLFAAMGGEDKFYGRNFDWEMSPALLLFNHPTDGYDSASMVDIAYLVDANVDTLTDLPLE